MHSIACLNHCIGRKLMCCLCAGRTVLPKSVAASEQDQRWKAFVSARRCDSKSRGSIYDSVAGVRLVVWLPYAPHCVSQRFTYAGRPTHIQGACEHFLLGRSCVSTCFTLLDRQLHSAQESAATSAGRRSCAASRSASAAARATRRCPAAVRQPLPPSAAPGCLLRRGGAPGGASLT